MLDVGQNVLGTRLARSMHVLFGVIWRHIDQDGRLNHCRVQAVGVVSEVSNKTPLAWATYFHASHLLFIKHLAIAPSCRPSISNPTNDLRSSKDRQDAKGRGARRVARSRTFLACVALLNFDTSKRGRVVFSQ